MTTKIIIKKLAVRNKIKLVRLPSHLTHKLQPLDTHVFLPIKTEWDKMLVQYGIEQMGKSCGRLPKDKFAELLGQCWIKKMNNNTIKAGFTSTGMFPVDASKFSTDNFDAAELQRYRAAMSTRTAIMLNEADSMSPTPTISPRVDFNSPGTSAAPNTSLSAIADEMTNLPSSLAPTTSRRPTSPAAEIGLSRLITDGSSAAVATASTSVGSSYTPQHGINSLTPNKRRSSSVSTPSYKTPKKSSPKKILNPSSIVELFTNKLGALRTTGEVGQKKVNTRLKQLRYGEVLTDVEVLNRLQAAEDSKSQKKATSEKRAENKRNKGKAGKVPAKNVKKPVNKQDNTSESTKTVEMEEIPIESDSPRSQTPDFPDLEKLCDDNSDDEDIDALYRHLPEVEYETPSVEQLKAGKYILADFIGGSRKTIHFRYVCFIRSVDDDDGEMIVVSMKKKNDGSTEFVMDDNDVSAIQFEQVIAILPEPELAYRDRHLVYTFPGCVSVSEKAI